MIPMRTTMVAPIMICISSWSTSSIISLLTMSSSSFVRFVLFVSLVLASRPGDGENTAAAGAGVVLVPIRLPSSSVVVPFLVLVMLVLFLVLVMFVVFVWLVD